MDELQEILQRIDWDIVFPLFTLVIGFLLGYGKDYLDRRRRVKNLKYILMWELYYNYLTLVRISEEKKPKLGKVKRQISDLSILVFDSYLDRFDTIDRRELVYVYNSFFQIREMKSFINELEEKMKSEKYREKMSDEKAASLLQTFAENVVKHTEMALLKLGFDKEVLESGIDRDEIATT